MEIPYAGRATINEFYNGVEIVIPAQRKPALIIFMCVWLCGWLAGMIFVPIMAFGSWSDRVPSAFLMIWLCGWAVGGFFAIATLCWYVAGKEIITIKEGVLTILKKNTLAKTKSYNLAEARNFRALQDFIDDFAYSRNQRSNKALWNIASQGTIKFDYGMETVKFGDKLFQAEGDYILERLRAKRLVQ